jgi:serine/threonine protein phosphatase 1
MKIWAIPDIHGRKDLLDRLLHKLFQDHKLDLTVDKLVFLGDMVDRGTDSYGVIETIKNLQEAHPNNVVALAGNHEWINIQYYTRKSEDDIWLWENNGGPATELSYQMVGCNRMTEEHLRWLAFLPLKHEEPGFFFSHAPAPRDSHRKLLFKGLPDLQPDELLWTYSADEFGVARDHGDGVVGVCGHIHKLRQGIMEPRYYPHYIFADSGCGCSPRAPLVAIDVINRKHISVFPNVTK